jgi:hypothetical protein
MSLSSKPKPFTTPTSPLTPEKSRSKSLSPPTTPNTQKKGWGSWISWGGWRSKPQDAPEQQETIPSTPSPQIATYVDENQFRIHSILSFFYTCVGRSTTVDVTVASKSQVSPKPKLPFLMNLIIKSGSLCVQNCQLSSPTSVENVAFLKFDWLGVRLHTPADGRRAETFIGARQISVAPSSSAAPCVSYNGHTGSGSADPAVVCAPDSFFSTIREEDRPLHSLDGWKELYRQFSMLIHSVDYSVESSSTLQTFTRPKISVFINNTSVKDAQDIARSTMRFVTPKSKRSKSKSDLLRFPNAWLTCRFYFQVIQSS